MRYVYAAALPHKSAAPYWRGIEKPYVGCKDFVMIEVLAGCGPAVFQGARVMVFIALATYVRCSV